MFDTVLMPALGVLPVADVAGMQATTLHGEVTHMLPVTQSASISSWVDDCPPPPPPAK